MCTRVFSCVRGCASPGAGAGAGTGAAPATEGGVEGDGAARAAGEGGAPVLLRLLLGYLLQYCLYHAPPPHAGAAQLGGAPVARFGNAGGGGGGALCCGADERSAGFFAVRSCVEQAEAAAEAADAAGVGAGGAAWRGVVRAVFAHVCALARGTPAPLPAGYQWNYSTSEEGKGDACFVGLRNLSSTCYLNSAVQQLFMSTAFRRGIMAANPLVPLDVARQVGVGVRVWGAGCCFFARACARL